MFLKLVKTALLSLGFFLFSPLAADELTIDPPTIWEGCFLPCRPPCSPPCPSPLEENQILVDLIDPLYEEGTLKTESGGVLTAPNIRIQARKIIYTRNLEHDPPILTVFCEGDLLIDYREWALVGTSLYYDFTSNTGYLMNGRTATPPWYVGGKEFLLSNEGDLVVLEGFITTSEGESTDVALQSPRIALTPDRVLTASHINLRIKGIPLFWFPKLELDLNALSRSPFAVKYGWGGFLGSYVSLLYRFLSWHDLKATARIDDFFGKGLGGGIETVYNPCWRPTQIYTRNYYAHDIPLDDPERRDRYRFQGTFYDRIYGVTIDGLYDFVSDAQMASDYQTKDFDLKTAGRTQIELRRKEPLWIADLFTKVRVNSFQSVNQELPSFYLNLHPFEIPYTGIVCENTFKASYLNYVFSEQVPGNDFASGRIAIHPFFYRPLFLGPVTVTPEAGLIGIAYTNTPGGNSAGQALGEFGLKVESLLSKYSGAWKHAAEPYLHYHYLTSPTVPPDRHYIFTIHDGWDRLNMLRFGLRNSFFVKNRCGIERFLWIDLWSNAFFDTKTFKQSIPRGYLNLEWIPFTQFFLALDSAWNFQEGELDFYNLRADWTFNEHCALGAEYRHRSAFDWRKADFYNFILESVRTQEELLHSALSDRRDLFLLRFFTRMTPDWTLLFELRHGWNRRHQGPFLEYQIESNYVIFQHWRTLFKFEKRESDNRFSFSIQLDPGPPPKRKGCY